MDAKDQLLQKAADLDTAAEKYGMSGQVPLEDLH